MECFENSNLRSCMDVPGSFSSSDSAEEDSAHHRIKDYFEKIVKAYSDAEFKLNFHLERSSFNSLMTCLEPLMNITLTHSTHTGAKLSIPHDKMVIITIYYLANQDSFTEIANLFDLSVSATHAVINFVINLLFTHSPKFIKWPSREDAQKNEELFFNKRGLRNVLGCIDGCHITIMNVEKDKDYINRKIYSSILLQGVVNYNMEFIDVYCGEPGPMHNSRLLQKSGLYRKMQENPNLIYGYFLLGDSAYMCQDWLVPPFKDNGSLTTDECCFNYIHSSLRARVENAFSMLKERFRRLREFQNLSTSFIIKSTISTIVLHNICRAANDEVEVAIEHRNQPQFFEPEDISIGRRSSRRQQAFLQLVETRTVDTI